MKLIKSIVVAIACASTAYAYAEGAEEVCYGHAEINVRIKRMMVNDPDFFETALKDNEKSKNKPSIKAAVRENYFWINNRKHLSDDDIRRLAFLNCLSRVM